jgi:hypothetical protein
MSELAERKYRIAYDQIGMAGAGTICRDDLLSLGAQLLSAFGELLGTPKGAALIDAMRTYWSRLCVIAAEHGDLDEEQAAFSEDEYITLLRAGFLASRQEFDDFAAPMWDAVFAVCDFDDDGQVGIEEFCACQVVLGTPIELIGGAFQAISDGARTVSCDSLLDAARVFYTSTDAADTRNHLFGVLA